MVLITRRWRRKLPFWVLVGLEFPTCIAALTLYAIAQPDLYRTKLQLLGYQQGWNSDPSLKLYAAANHRPFSPPLPWSRFMTEFNVVISIVSLFILLTKVTTFVLHCFIPLVSVIIHLILIGLYAFSIGGQASPDKADPKNIQSGAPWFLSKGCSWVPDAKLKGYCMQAQACFAITVLMLVIYIVYLGFSIHSMIPTEAQREKYLADKAELAEMREFNRLNRGQQSVLTEEMQMHLQGMPTPGLPPPTAGGTVVTPRTNAFNLLSGVAPAPAFRDNAMRLRPETTLIIPKSVPVHGVSPPTSTTTSPEKSDLPFRNFSRSP